MVVHEASGSAAFMAMRERHSDILKCSAVFRLYQKLNLEPVGFVQMRNLFSKSRSKGDLYRKIMAKNRVMVRWNPIMLYEYKKKLQMLSKLDKDSALPLKCSYDRYIIPEVTFHHDIILCHSQ